MVIGNTAEVLEVDNVSIKQTNEHKYLGVTLTDTGTDEMDIMNKIKKRKTITR